MTKSLYLLGGAERRVARPRGFAPWNPQPGAQVLLEQIRNVLIEYDEHLPLTCRQALDHFIGSQVFIAAARLGHLCIEEMTEDAEGGGNQPSGRYLFTDAKAKPSQHWRIALMWCKRRTATSRLRPR
jgi:hypothetical protein